MDIERWLATHDGVASRARACGLSEDTIARKVASGEWLRRAPAVYFAVAWTWTPAARVRVAAEWVRPVGALASVTAAWWLGLGVASPHPLTVALPRGCSRRVPPGIAVWQRHPGPDRRDHRGLPVVGTALAVLDTAVAPGREGPAFLDRGGTAARAGRRPGRVRARAPPAGAAARRRRDRLVGQPRGHPVRRSAHRARRGVPRPPVRHRG